VSFLLDTQVFLWLLGEPDRVAESVRSRLADRDNPLFVSAVSAMEVATKVRLGKLAAAGLVETWQDRVGELAAAELSLTTPHALLAGSMAWEHRDPFDRMLVAQALVENLTLVTNDRAIVSIPGLKSLAWGR
jgi:PIN domain nuclease of toxin-antitoxin system